MPRTDHSISTRPVRYRHSGRHVGHDAMTRPIKYHGKADVLSAVPDAQIHRAKGGWVVSSPDYGDLNDFSFDSAQGAWADAYDTVRMGWHKKRRATLKETGGSDA